MGRFRLQDWSWGTYSWPCSRREAMAWTQGRFIISPTCHYRTILRPYRWLRDVWGADAVIHFGKHGTLEWLPGKGVGLSRSSCAARRVSGRPAVTLPVYLNDPGEGSQAKPGLMLFSSITWFLRLQRRVCMASRELAQLVDEYYQVELLDPSKLPLLQRQIWDLIKRGRRAWTPTWRG